MAEAKSKTEPEDLAPAAQERPSEAGHVYQALADLLARRGWSQGRSARGRLTLDAAVDELLGTRVGDPATGAQLARAGRITAHLRELSGDADLAAWNDAAERRLEDVHRLLELAGRAYPAD